MTSTEGMLGICGVKPKDAPYIRIGRVKVTFHNGTGKAIPSGKSR